MRNAEQCFAIIRIDDLPTDNLELRVRVKAIVWSEEEARSETARLNTENAAKGCVYFWQTTRCVSRT